jgi:hypothetical protein
MTAKAEPMAGDDVVMVERAVERGGASSASFQMSRAPRCRCRETLPCTIIDYSIGGAAVFAAVMPAAGTALKIAKLFGSLVHHFNGGFAAYFVKVQEDAKLAGTLPRDEVSGHLM